MSTPDVKAHSEDMREKLVEEVWLTSDIEDGINASDAVDTVLGVLSEANSSAGVEIRQCRVRRLGPFVATLEKLVELDKHLLIQHLDPLPKTGGA